MSHTRWLLLADEELGEYVEADFQVPFDAGPNNELDDADFAVICEELA